MPSEPVALPYEEFKKYEPPEHKFLVEDLVVGAGIHMIYGKRGTGKTQLVFTLLRSILNGEPFLDRYEIPEYASDARVAYFSVDMPHSHVKDRLENLDGEFARPEDFFVVASDGPVNIRAVRGDEEWLQDLRDFQPDLIAIDTLHKIHALDENSSQTVSIVYQTLGEVFGNDTSIVLVHHASKSSPDPNAQRDDDEKQRGSTAWVDDADLGILVERLKNNLASTIDVSFPRVRFCEEQSSILCKMNSETMLVEPKTEREAVDFVMEMMKSPEEWETRDMAERLIDEGYSRGHAYRAIREVEGSL